MLQDNDSLELLRKTFQLTRENNDMLHSMRRRAFAIGLIKFILYVAVILLPIWYYSQYIAPTMAPILKQLNIDTGVDISSQLMELSKLMNYLKQSLPN